MPEDKIIRHLKRIEGQVRGLQRMVQETRPCDEILPQIMAVKAALDRVTTDLVQDNLATCFENMTPDEAKRKMARTLDILCRM